MYADGIVREANMSYYIGIDVGGTKIAYGLFDSKKNLVAKLKTPTDTGIPPEVFFDAICVRLDEFLHRNSVRLDDVDGIGIGMPSFIYFDKGFVVKTASIPLIHDFPLRDYLRGKRGDRIRIVIDNDGNTGALAEFRNGAGRGFEHMVFCLVSTGIGSSLIINKSLFRGTYGWAGESGHTLIKPHDPCDFVCGCNNTSCLNSICSGKMIVNHIRKWITDGESTLMLQLAGDEGSINTEHLNRAYELGDEMAARAVEQMAQYMAIWLYNIYLTLNINCFVFSGGLLAMGDKLFGRVKQLFDQYNKSEYPVYFYNTELGADTGIIGAMELLFPE
jgi:glucokinase